METRTISQEELRNLSAKYLLVHFDINVAGMSSCQILDLLNALQTYMWSYPKR